MYTCTYIHIYIYICTHISGTAHRCPFGTMTGSDGQQLLITCAPRTSIFSLQEGLPIVVARVNPVNPEASTVRPIRTLGNPVFEEDMRLAYRASAGSVFLVSIDIRHLPANVVYGRDWRLKFLVNNTLDLAWDDPLECDAMLARTEQDSNRREEVVNEAQERGCLEVPLPTSFEQRPQDFFPQDFGGTLSFVFHPLIDCEWRIELQIINGLFQPD